jgi:anthranilate synthase/aminodeoxychorismate synthase-like glutamine amidotransferase
MIFILDNYDSFTYNLVQLIGQMGVRVHVERNDRINAREVLDLKPAGMVLSPGPGRPESAGNMPAIFAECAGRLPVLGVCLGCQMIGQHFGARIISAKRLVHGKTSPIDHDGRTIFARMPRRFEGGRYHSLALDQGTLPECLAVSARAEDGEIMAIRHVTLAVEGVQFHPESILTPWGGQLVANFVHSVEDNPHTMQSENTPSGDQHHPRNPDRINKNI